MKKILAAFSLMFALLSCSDNDDKIKNEIPVNRVTATIDGQDFVFDNFQITKEDYVSEETGYEWTDIRVIGHINDDPLRIIEFIAEEGNVGSDAMWRFIITTDGKSYIYEKYNNTTNSNIAILVTESTHSVLKGIFSGTLNADDGSTIFVTGGNFNIKHDN